MAGKSSDIELIAGLKGGGSIHGTSGKRIQDQVNSILQHVKVKPIDVELRLDPESVNKFKRDLDELTQHARKSASDIQAAFKTVMPTGLIDRAGETKSGSAERLEQDQKEYNRALDRTLRLLNRIKKSRDKWQDANEEGHDGRDFYNQILEAEKQLQDVKDRVKKTLAGEDGGFKGLFEFDVEIAEIRAAFDAALKGLVDIEKKSKSLKTLSEGTKEYRACLKSLNAELDKAEAKKKKYSAAEDYDGTKQDYLNIDEKIRALNALKEDMTSKTKDEFYLALGVISDDLNGYYRKIELAGKNLSKTEDTKKYVNQLDEVNKAIEKAEQNIKEWSAAKDGATSGDYDGLNKLLERLRSLRDELVDSGNSLEKFGSTMAEINKLEANFGTNIKKSGKDHKTFGDKTFGLVSDMLGYIDTMDVMFEVFNQSKKMISNVTEIDTAMTELRKVTDETEASYSAFLDKASVRAREFGSTVSAVVSASADFARLGHDLDGASALADAAIVYQNVGDGINDVETASSSIISTMQAFGVEAENAMSIVDKFNAVGNNFAISSSGIGDALLNSAASLHAAGNTLDESIALIAAANTTIQDPGRVGTALKTLSMYLRAAKTEAEDAGISTEGMADSVSQLREELMALTGGKVDIMSDAEAGSYKSTVEILRELSQVWNDLSDTSRTNITELIGGGVRNANIISALMNNFSIVEDAMATSAESSGSALAENEKYLDSINGKIQQFKASYETLSSTMFDSELIKGVVWLGTGLVDGLTLVADNLGPVLTALTAGSVVGSISNITELIKGLDKEKGLGKFLTSMKENGSGIAGGGKLTLLQIRPPHRDGNIERVARQGDAKQMARGFYLDKWCA